MSTLNLPHVIAGDFNAALYSFLRQREDFVPRVYLDGKNIPTLGIGYALVVKDPDGVYVRRSNQELTAKFDAMGITLTGNDIAMLDAAATALNSGTVPSGIAHWNSQNPDPTNTPFSFGTITETQFQPLFNLLVDDATAALIAKIGQPTFSALAGSNEMVALLSMTFNSPKLIGPNLIYALQTGNRAEAWYEIRYQSNREQVTAPNLANGIANRRYAEAGLFGLEEDAPMSEPEAKSIFRMYTEHRATILDYEQKFSVPMPYGTFRDESQGARNVMITQYASGLVPFGTQWVAFGPIDFSGDVLVGQDFGRGDVLTGTDYADLVLGEQGNDVLRGGAGNDVLRGGAGSDTLLGGVDDDMLFGELGDDTLQGGDGGDWLFGDEGNDMLVGGKGDDRLAGGEGFDTYVYNTGDGNDRIEDSDASGVIIVNGQMLAGGVKKADHTYWESPDGSITYEMLGTDLVVKLYDDIIMTVNENFVSGQFGIRLIDVVEERMAA